METMFLRQMTGGDSWVQAVFLAGVFLAVLFRRDHIVSPYMFRVSIILFALSLIVPIVITTIRGYTMAARSGGFMTDQNVLFHSLMTAIGPMVFALSVLLCILSMLPPQSRYPATPEHRQAHPLD
jgi:hypothetical protein